MAINGNPAPFMPTLPRLLMHRDMNVFPSWAHPEVRYWARTWLIIRDCMLGEQEIKDKGETYLPRMSEMEQTEYDAYSERAVFYNMTARTVNAQIGTIFQRLPKVTGIPAKLEKAFKTVVYNGISFNAFLTGLAEGIIAMGRYGLLVDMAQKGGQPYLRGYDTENIIDWQLDWVNGRYQPVQIILREFEEVNKRKVGETRVYRIIYRVLSLDYEDAEGNAIPPVYRQYVYEVNSMSASLSQTDPKVITPTNRGKTFDFIPFTFLGSKDNTPAVDRPPAADIASLNIAHYRAYAHLEHGRFYCAMPVYYVQVTPANEKAEYVLGPSRVWEVAQGEKPGILEFHGTGLLTLENSCAQKEEQIAAIGGRLMGNAAKVGSESDNQAKIKESNERATLLKAIANINEGVSKAITWWCDWQDAPDADIEVDLNTAFLFDNLGARELRAAHQMYKEGLIPVTALHFYLQKAEVLPEWMDIDEFKGLLNRIDEFPNQPDVWAMMMGYSSKQQQIDTSLEKRSLSNDEQLTQVQKDRLALDGKKAADGTDIAQQTVDVQQQVADQTGAAAEAEGTLAKKQHMLDQQQQTHEQKMDKKAAANAGRPVTNNPNSRPLPGQVSAGRTAAKNQS